MSKMKMQALVQTVESRVVKEGTPDQRTIYDVIDGDGVKWTAWERDLAVLANSFKGQQAMWEVDQKQNGKYTNRTLLAIHALGNANMTKALDSVTTGNGATSLGVTDNIPPSGTTLTAKDTSIHRQTAVKAVAVLAQAGGMTAEEFWGNVEDIVTFFETGRTPLRQTLDDQLVRYVPGPQDPEFGDPGPQDFPPATDDDIPF